MSTSTLYDVLDSTIGADPPTRLDIDMVIAQSRRGVRRRRLVGGGVAASLVSVLAIVVTAGGLPGALGMFGGSRDEGTGRSGIPAGAPGGGVTESFAEAIPRLEATIEGAVRAAAPGATMTGYDGGPPFEIHYSAGDGFPVERDSSMWLTPMPTYRGHGYVTWLGEENQLTVIVGWGRWLDVGCASAAPQCTEHAAPNMQRVMSQPSIEDRGLLSGDPGLNIGERLVLLPGAQTDRYFINNVWVDRGDGSYVFVSVSPEGSDGTMSASSPVLDPAVLERIALDPGLTVYA
jgi:hypothetical protein